MPLPSSPHWAPSSTMAGTGIHLPRRGESSRQRPAVRCARRCYVNPLLVVTNEAAGGTADEAGRGGAGGAAVGDRRTPGGVPRAGRPGPGAGRARRAHPGGGRRRRLRAHGGRDAALSGRAVGGPAARPDPARHRQRPGPDARASRWTRLRRRGRCWPAGRGRSTWSWTTPAAWWSTPCTSAWAPRRPRRRRRSRTGWAGRPTRSAAWPPVPARPAGACRSWSTVSWWTSTARC